MYKQRKPDLNDGDSQVEVRCWSTWTKKAGLHQRRGSVRQSWLAWIMLLGKHEYLSPILVHSILSYLYSTYVGPYVAAGVASLAAHSYCAQLLPPHAPIVLPHSVSFIKQVCPTVSPCWAMLTEGEGKRTADETWDDRAATLHCLWNATSLTLAPQCSHSPSIVVSWWYRSHYTSATHTIWI